jgi:hypothetical protein
VYCARLLAFRYAIVPPWNDGKGLKMQADSSSKASETNDQSSRWHIPEVSFINALKTSTT